MVSRYSVKTFVRGACSFASFASPAGPSSGCVEASLDATATTASPRARYSRANFANSDLMCFTYGQWVQMKATSNPGAFANCSDETSVPSRSGNENAGSFVLSGSMVEGVSAIHAA